MMLKCWKWYETMILFLAFKLENGQGDRVETAFTKLGIVDSGLVVRPL